MPHASMQGLLSACVNVISSNIGLKDEYMCIVGLGRWYIVVIRT
jgi:hypothetical protein